MEVWEVGFGGEREGGKGGEVDHVCMQGRDCYAMLCYAMRRQGRSAEVVVGAGNGMNGSRSQAG